MSLELRFVKHDGMMLLIVIRPCLTFAVLSLHLLNQRCFPLRIDESDCFHFPLFLIIWEGFLSIHFHMNNPSILDEDNRNCEFIFGQRKCIKAEAISFLYGVFLMIGTYEIVVKEQSPVPIKVRIVRQYNRVLMILCHIHMNGVNNRVLLAAIE